MSDIMFELKIRPWSYFLRLTNLKHLLQLTSFDWNSFVIAKNASVASVVPRCCPWTKKPYIHACIKMNSLLTFKFTWHSIMNIASSLFSGHLYFYKKDNHEGMQLAEYSSDLGSPEKGWSKCFIYCSTACVNVNCAGKFHTLRHRIVRRIYTILLCTQSKKMRNSTAFVIHCYKFRLYYIVV